jgi:aspartyl aminopeptidase
MNEGVVIKSNASQKYTTDAVSAAMFSEICKRADVPVQLFANRSDMGGGSTLGSISNTNVALNTIDIGLAQLAMHSSYETGGCADTLYMIRAITQFYKSAITAEADGIYNIE